MTRAAAVASRRPACAARRGRKTDGAAGRPSHTARTSHRNGLDLALDPVRRDLEAVTERVLSQLADPIARMVGYLVTAGGKRLRPALVLLAGQSGPAPDRSSLVETATAIELIHTATLIHDDIIDQSTLRRQQPTFHHRWGTERAVLMGDYLYATAFTLLARVPHGAVMQIMADVCQRLSRGELLEVEARFRLDLTEAEYLEIIREKTASLFGGCCRSGAVLGGFSAEQAQRLGTFGELFGLAFQIVDDCLDLIGDQRQLGKSIHADLDKGALSLPMIYLAQQLSPQERRRLFAPLRTQANDPKFLARVAKAASESGAITKAQQRARAFVRSAQGAIAGAALNGLDETYHQLAEYAASRRS